MSRAGQMGTLKRGRKPAEEKRTVRLKVYVTVKDADRIYQMVLKRGVSLSAMVREILRELIGP